MKRKTKKQISLMAIFITMLISTTVFARRLNAVDGESGSNGQVVITQSDTCIAPAISTQPANLIRVSKGSVYTFSIEAAGTGPLSYQWYKSGTPAVPVGTNSNSFTICNVDRSNAGYYYVVVTNNCGTVTSKLSGLALESPPKSSTVSCPSLAVAPAFIPFAIDAVDGTITGVLESIVDTPDPLVSEGTRTYIYSFRNRAGCSANWSYTYTIDYSGGLAAPANTASTVSSLAEAVDPGAPADIIDACGRKVSAQLVGSSAYLPDKSSIIWTYRYTACDGTTTADWNHIYTIDDSDILSTSTNTVSGVSIPVETATPGTSQSTEKSGCLMIIPNGFSPNGDGINDYLRVTCIDKYPDAKLLIYSGTLTLLYEQEHYGNYDFWGSEDAAWWNGTDRDKTKLASGTYIYILDLDHVKKDPVKTGYVFISR
jgi:gliding motility-associated-like protein